MPKPQERRPAQPVAPVEADMSDWGAHRVDLSADGVKESSRPAPAQRQPRQPRQAVAPQEENAGNWGEHRVDQFAEEEHVRATPTTRQPRQPRAGVLAAGATPYHCLYHHDHVRHHNFARYGA